jgi:hypothetical protein
MRPIYIFDHVSFGSSYNENCFRKKVVKKIKTRILYSTTRSENRTFCKLMWKNIIGTDREQMTIWHTPIACWKHKATNQHSVHVKLTTFQWELCLYESASMYTVLSSMCHHHHHHHHISVMELGDLLTRSGLTYPEVSSKVCHDSFCQFGNSVLLCVGVCANSPMRQTTA